MITTFSFQNFKALRDVTIELDRMTVFVGPNGVGKSTALQGIQLLTTALTAKEIVTSQALYALQTAAGLLQSDLQSLVSQPHAGPSMLSARTGDGFVVSVGWQTSSDRFVGRFLLDHFTAQPFAEWNVSAMKGPAELTPLHLQLSAHRLATPSPATVSTPVLSAQGDGLATVLQALAASRDGRLEAIEGALRELVPAFLRVHTPSTRTHGGTSRQVDADGRVHERFEKGEIPGFGLELEFDRIGRIPASHVSEGTLLALGLLTALHMESVRLLLMDDVDRALHPAAQQHMIRLFSGILDQQPDLQLIMTTHSPDLVNACHPEQIRVFGSTTEGVAVRRLDAHPEAKEWLKMLRGGEFWSTVGEDWVGGAGLQGGE